MLTKTPEDQLPNDQQDMQDNSELMQALGEEVRSYIDERFAAERGISDAGLRATIAAIVKGELAGYRSDMEALVKSLSAPKRIVLDDQGRPVGVEVGTVE